MSNEEKPITSRRERRLAQAALAAGQQAQLTPAQAEAEARGRAEAEREAPRALSSAQSATAAAARGEASPQDAADSGAGRTDHLRPRRAHQLAAAPPPASGHEPEPAQQPDDMHHSERSSQARARDRAAQRVLRELAEKEQAAQSAQQAFPTRRSIRERETGRIPSVEAPSAAPKPQPHESSAGPAAGQLPVVPSPQGAASSGRAPIPGVDPAPPTAMQGIVPLGLTVTPALGPETGSFRKLSHDQIAAARELLKEQAKNQTAMIDAQRDASGTEVDPAVLAEQVAMAERAAILNRRAQAKQRLAEESRREATAPARKAPAPAATDNLAMVTPLEFVRLPGVPHPVMKPPTTTHVPVITGKTVKQATPTRQRRPEMPEAVPVSARRAHGLEPLNSAQTGMGRAEKERLILLGIGAVGLIALIVAIIMIVLGGR
ncbi:hypothetical protein GCM10027449_29500 [Sinomonas notoginsengisoli]|uniref:hypothetical protein n=1 Tax=Sinomonas notoginsengisoli TaxID=1457311 RepID=UPI001F1DC8DC|nr:hypothetical protein [Sinomonas notoginsengisoli]